MEKWSDNVLSLARLDRFYGYRHQLNLFKECSIIPVGFSDHSLVKCSVTMGSLKPKSAYWHLNANLLCDRLFQDSLRNFGLVLDLENHPFNLCNSGGSLQRHKLDNCVSSTLLM